MLLRVAHCQPLPLIRHATLRQRRCWLQLTPRRFSAHFFFHYIYATAALPLPADAV